MVEVIERKGLLRLAEPVQLASGAWSREFVDVKAALCDGRDLAAACDLLLERLRDAGIAFDAIGGLTMGADQFAYGTAICGDKSWFVVRKAAKGRGTNRRVEGARLGGTTRVVLVEDAATTGESMREALHVVRSEAGCQVVAAVAIVDRGESARRLFEAEGVPYLALVTYRDLGIPAVSDAGGEAT